jgi:hypothetical protein
LAFSFADYAADEADAYDRQQATGLSSVQDQYTRYVDDVLRNSTRVRPTAPGFVVVRTAKHALPYACAGDVRYSRAFATCVEAEREAAAWREVGGWSADVEYQTAQVTS